MSMFAHNVTPGMPAGIATAADSPGESQHLYERRQRRASRIAKEEEHTTLHGRTPSMSGLTSHTTGEYTKTDLAQLGTEGAHLRGALRGVARALGVGQDVEAARQDVAVALQLRFGELQGHAGLPLGPHRHPQLLLAARQRPLLQQLLRQIRLQSSNKTCQGMLVKQMVTVDADIRSKLPKLVLSSSLCAGHYITDVAN